jgi:hypothetical protein
MQRCYEHVDDEEGGTSTANPETEQLKKKAESSRAQEGPEEPPSKRRRTMQDWSEDEAEEDMSAYMLNPRKKRSEQTRQEGSTPPVKGPQEGQTPPVGPAPSVRTAEEQARPPPQDGGQGSSA